MKIGIIGQGFVGNAVYQKFKNYYNVLTYDLQAKLCNSSLEEVYGCDHIFICLPTPMDKDGKWHKVPVDKGMITVNVGDMLQMASGGYFPSTSHRVVNPESYLEVLS